MKLKKITLAVGMIMAVTAAAQAVSIGELATKCGDDSKQHCKGVGYGEPMQVCLNASYKKLQLDCKAVMDRLNDSERVTLF